jgi:two-component system, NarL family, response regulator DegU
MGNVAVSNKIKILIIDDHSIVKDGLSEIISKEEDITVVGTGANGEQAIELVKKLKPNVVLLDIDMPVMDGVKAARIIKDEFPETEIIMLSMYDDDKNIFEAIKAGATGYILKNIPREELIKSIRIAYTGESLIDPSVARKLIDKFVYLSKEPGKEIAKEECIISKRELEVLKLVAEGNSNIEISKVLFISDKTVKAHMRSIFKKLEVTDRAQAVATAIRMGLF